MTHFPGYTTSLENLERRGTAQGARLCPTECSRGCADMEGMTARVFAIEAELEYRNEEAGTEPPHRTAV